MIMYITAARITDGLAPAIGIKHKIAATETIEPNFLPNTIQKKVTRNPTCIPETAVL